MTFHLVVNHCSNSFPELIDYLGQVILIIQMAFNSFNGLPSQVVQQFCILVIIYFIIIHQGSNYLIYRRVKFSPIQHLQNFHRFLPCPDADPQNFLLQCRQVKSHSCVQVEPFVFSLVRLLLNGHTRYFYNIVNKIFDHYFHHLIYLLQQRLGIFCRKQRIHFICTLENFIPCQHLNGLYIFRASQFLSIFYRCIHLWNNLPHRPLGIRNDMRILLFNLCLGLLNSLLFLDVNQGLGFHDFPLNGCQVIVVQFHIRHFAQYGTGIARLGYHSFKIFMRNDSQLVNVCIASSLASIRQAQPSAYLLFHEDGRISCPKRNNSV